MYVRESHADQGLQGHERALHPGNGVTDIGDPHHGDTGNQALPLEERSVTPWPWGVWGAGVLV